MSFYFGKIVWMVLQPTVVSVITLAIGLTLMGLERRRRFGRGLAAMALIALAGMGISPLSYLLAIPLEQQFPRPDPASMAPPAAIIVLGGSVDNITSLGRNEPVLNEAAERLTTAAMLARRFPAARLVLAGGKGSILYDTVGESAVMQDFLEQLGIDKSRFVLDEKSRSTVENVEETKALIDADPRLAGGPLLLVTSAYHMPRAVGSYRKAGLVVTAYPTDYRTRGWVDINRFPDFPSDGWRRSDIMVREWLGLLAYWLLGQSSALLPSP